MKNAKRILCPVDFSDATQSAIDLASLLAREDESKLFIVHVMEPPTPSGPGMYGRLEEEDDGHELFEVLPSATNVEFEHDLLQGDPVTELLRFVEDKDIDLVVIGSHGRTGLRRVLLGSIAEQVVRRSPVPVMTVSMKAATPAAETAK